MLKSSLSLYMRLYVGTRSFVCSGNSRSVPWSLTLVGLTTFRRSRNFVGASLALLHVFSAAVCNPGIMMDACLHHFRAFRRYRGLKRCCRVHFLSSAAATTFFLASAFLALGAHAVRMLQQFALSVKLQRHDCRVVKLCRMLGLRLRYLCVSILASEVLSRRPGSHCGAWCSVWVVVGTAASPVSEPRRARSICGMGPT